MVVPSRKKRELIKDSVTAIEQNSSGVRNGLKQMEKKTDGKVSFTYMRKLLAHWIQFLSSTGEDYEDEKFNILALFFSSLDAMYIKKIPEILI